MAKDICRVSVDDYGANTHLIDGAEMTPISISLPMQSGWLGPTTKMCFRKKEFNSTSCRKRQQKNLDRD